MTEPKKWDDRWHCAACGVSYLFYTNASQCCVPEVRQEVAITSTRTIPERYSVDLRGTPDPDAARYVVLDVVHDWPARESLRRLVNLYMAVGATTHAQELEQYLDDTQEAARAVIMVRNERRMAATGARRRRKK